jgi:hypothetical protein
VQRIEPEWVQEIDIDRSVGTLAIFANLCSVTDKAFEVRVAKGRHFEGMNPFS